MRILVVSNALSHDDLRQQLADLCEGYSLQFVHNIQQAKDFINNNIVKFQLPLDLVIIYSSNNDGPSNDFRDFIRNDYERTYSNYDFNLSELPLILIVEEELNKRVFLGYDLTVYDLGVERLNQYVKDFALTIKRWRKKVLVELESLGIRLNSGIIDYGTFFSEKRIITASRIISSNFKRVPRKLNYYWLEYNKKQIEQSIDEFLKMLKRSESIGKKGEEKLYHKFFKANKAFLLRDAYSKYWYEPRFYKKDDRFEEPDFTLKPNMTYESDLSLIEVKLPNETFLKKSDFHKAPKQRFMQHLFQVNDYKDYLESDKFLSEINNVLGFIPKKVNYNLLIGRQQDKEENLYYLEKRMGQMSQQHVKLMTFDELMEYQVKFLERMQLLDITNY